jgi:hypothetical protein
MPTVLRFAGLRVVIYPNDHRPAHVHVIGPAHVHVIGGGCEAVFNLDCPDGPPELRENYGFARHELARIVDTLRQAIADLCAQWRMIHGQP